MWFLEEPLHCVPWEPSLGLSRTEPARKQNTASRCPIDSSGVTGMDRLLWGHSVILQEAESAPLNPVGTQSKHGQPWVRAWELHSPVPCEAHLLYRLHGPAFLPPALRIRITCYYMSLLLDAFQREAVPLCNESCAPLVTLWGQEKRQCQRKGNGDCDMGCDEGYDGLRLKLS